MPPLSPFVVVGVGTWAPSPFVVMEAGTLSLRAPLRDRGGISKGRGRFASMNSFRGRLCHGIAASQATPFPTPRSMPSTILGA